MHNIQLESYFRYHQVNIAFELVNKYAGANILDIGCGDGTLEDAFSEKKLVAIDISRLSIGKAREIAPEAAYLVADARKLPVSDRSVDSVAMIAILGGIPEGQEYMVFEEAWRVLRPGGHIIMLVSNDIMPFSLLVPDRLFGGWKWRHFKLASLRQQLIDSRFTIVEIIATGSLLSLVTSLSGYLWRFCWRRLTCFLIGRAVVPGLPYKFINKILSREFLPKTDSKAIRARYLYIVAKKSIGC